MDETNNTSSITIDNEAGQTPAANEQPVSPTAQDLANVVEELKALRKKNAELTAQLTSKSEGDNNTQVDIKATIEQALKEKEVEVQKANRQNSFNNALANFRNSIKELNPANDPDGLAFKKLENSLKIYNLSALSTEEEFTSVLKKAGMDAGFITTVVEPTSVAIPTHTATPTTTSHAAANADKPQLTAAEENLLKNNPRWTTERLLEMKKTMPAGAYAELISNYE